MCCKPQGHPANGASLDRFLKTQEKDRLKFFQNLSYTMLQADPKISYYMVDLLEVFRDDFNRTLSILLFLY